MLLRFLVDAKRRQDSSRVRFRLIQHLIDIAQMPQNLPADQRLRQSGARRSVVPSLFSVELRAIARPRRLMVCARLCPACPRAARHAPCQTPGQRPGHCQRRRLRHAADGLRIPQPKGDERSYPHENSNHHPGGDIHDQDHGKHGVGNGKTGQEPDEKNGNINETPYDQVGQEKHGEQRP